MASSGNSDIFSNGSWVELDAESLSPSPVRTDLVNKYSVERLLCDARREFLIGSSRIKSVTSSAVVSPRSPPNTPNSEPLSSTNCSSIAPTTHYVYDDMDVSSTVDKTGWVLNWSSRPEAVPPSDCAARLKHPESKRWHKLSVRNTRVMDVILFSIENFPVLLITHACTFMFGAATMLMILKKYFNFSASVDG